MKKDFSFLTENLIAHRGYHNIEKGIPENSMLAFKEAIKKGFVIELDVHLLKDGNVVVFHDDNLNRMTGFDKEIKLMDYKEISYLRLKETNHKIPLLEEVLKLVDGKVPIIIELKYDVKCGLLEERVAKILKNYKGKYAVKGFNPFSIYYFRKKHPEIIRGQLVSNFNNERMSKIKKFFLKNMLFNVLSKPDFISCDVRTLPNKKISKLRKSKIILGWTVRSKDELNKFEKHCDNIIFENIFIK